MANNSSFRINMKSIILIGFLCCFTVGVFALNEKCKSNEDCGEGECCVEIVRFFPPKCRNLRQMGDHCVPAGEGEEGNSIHKFACPCAEGLVCKPAKTEDHNGVVHFLDEKCQEE